MNQKTNKTIQPYNGRRSCDRIENSGGFRKLHFVYLISVSSSSVFAITGYIDENIAAVCQLFATSFIVPTNNCKPIELNGYD